MADTVKFKTKRGITLEVPKYIERIVKKKKKKTVNRALRIYLENSNLYTFAGTKAELDTIKELIGLDEENDDDADGGDEDGESETTK